MKDKGTLSIIMPVYNAAEYLERSIESILAQDYSPLELILIDDGSTDNSSAICEHYTNLHNNVILIRSNNGGASKARNLGLRKATGKFITFVDSDDYLEPGIYSNALNSFTEDTDIVMFGVNTVNENGTVISTEKFLSRIYSADEIVKEFVSKLKTAVWNKIFRAEILENVEFPVEYRHNEDMVFCCRCLTRHTNLLTIPLVGYNYVKHSGSVTSGCFNEKSLDEINAKDMASDIIDSLFYNLGEYTMNIRIRGRMNILRRMASIKSDEMVAKRSEIKQWLKQHVKIRNLDWKAQLYYYIIMHDKLNKLIFG